SPFAPRLYSVIGPPLGATRIGASSRSGKYFHKVVAVEESTFSTSSIRPPQGSLALARMTNGLAGASRSAATHMLDHPASATFTTGKKKTQICQFAILRQCFRQDVCFLIRRILYRED